MALQDKIQIDDNGGVISVQVQSRSITGVDFQIDIFDSDSGSQGVASGKNTKKKFPIEGSPAALLGPNKELNTQVTVFRTTEGNDGWDIQLLFFQGGKPLKPSTAWRGKFTDSVSSATQFFVTRFE